MSIPGKDQRRFRLDDLKPRRKVLGRRVSGRRFVAIAVVTILAVWGTLYLAFSNWREGVQRRIELGKAEVLPAIDLLAEKVPEGIDPIEWNEAIEATQELLRRVVGTGQLDESELLALRDDLAERSERASAETAVAELSTIWDEMTARLGRLRGDLLRPGLLDAPEGAGAEPGGPSP